MSASIVFAYPPTGFGDPIFAIVADETHAQYVFPPGHVSYLDERQAADADREGRTPREWIEIAGANMSQMRFTDSIGADTFDAGVEMVNRLLSYMSDDTTPDTEEQST